MAESYERNTDEKPLLVYFQDRLFDVAKFAKKHPGGEKVLRRVAGEHIDKYVRGEERLLGVKHEHSAAAMTILNSYAVNEQHAEDPLLDINKPVLTQVGRLHDRYWTWIHQPLDRNLRLFASDYLEICTRTRWFVVPLVWLPLVIALGSMGINDFCHLYGLLWGGLLWSTLFALGSITWTLMEYTLHRFLFHWHPNEQSQTQITLHFLLHGLHHKTPMDGDRLVFPPVPATAIIGFFYVLYSSILPWPVFCAFAPGKLFGYICYDMIHYYLHHGSPEPMSKLHYRKVYHHNHHFKDGDSAYGISTNLWDYVFDTVGTGPL